MMDARIRGAESGLLEEARRILLTDYGRRRCAINRSDKIGGCGRARAWVEHLKVEVAGLGRRHACRQLSPAVERGRNSRPVHEYLRSVDKTLASENDGC